MNYKRVLFFKSTKVFAGGEKHTLQLAKGLKEADFRVKIYSDSPKLIEKARKGKLETSYFYWGEEAGNRREIIIFCLTFPWNFLKFIKILTVERIKGAKVIFFQSTNEKILASFMGKVLGMKVFWVEHLAWKPYLVANPLFCLLKFNLMFTTKIIVPSNFLKNEIQSLGVKNSKIKRIYHGIDLNQFRIKKMPHNKIIFGYVGRFHPEKGLKYLVEGSKKIRDNFEIWLIGEGPQKNWLKKQANNKIRIFEFTDRIENFYSKIDVFVLPTTRDNLPLSILEAGASSLPIIATDVGGISEIVRTNKNGILIPPKTAPALVRAMETFIEHKARREQMAKISLKISSAFSLEKMVLNYLELLND